ADMEAIVHRDRSLLWLNLMFLLSVSLLPFTTDLLGRDNTRSASWTLYAANMICCGLTLAALWAYATLAGFSRRSHRQAELSYKLGRHLIVALIFATSIPVGLVSPHLVPVLPAVLLPIAFRLYRRLPGYPRQEAHRHLTLAAKLLLYVGYLPVILFAGWSVVLKLNGSI
ncbi:MAG TPA: hypothetical protein VN961_09170, partial [Streptosporangiaceae bacterium]|nr:hypothetical protein [Streptosporangiaceae bacterium]